MDAGVEAEADLHEVSGRGAADGAWVAEEKGEATMELQLIPGVDDAADADTIVGFEEGEHVLAGELGIDLPEGWGVGLEGEEALLDTEALNDEADWC